MDDETKESNSLAQSYPVIKMSFGFFGDGETSGCPNEGGKSGPTPHKEKQNHARSFIQLDRVQKYLFSSTQYTHTHTVQWPWESHTEPHTHTRRKRLYQEMRESKSFRSIVTLHFDSFDFSTRPKLDSFLILHETISLKLALVCACLRFLAALPDNWMDTLNRTNRAAAARRNQLGVRPY